MDYIKLGKEIQLGFTSVKCIQSVIKTECEGCFFKSFPCCDHIVGECLGRMRPDKQDVIFVEVD